MALNKNKVIAAAQRYTQKNQLDRAIKEYRSIVEEDPADVRIWLKIGDLQTRKGEISQAVATYQRVASHYRDEGRLLKGVAVYKQILNIAPQSIEAHKNLGDLYVQLGFGPDAIAQFKIVVGTYERESRHRESLDLLKKIVELAPDDAPNRIRLAEAYARQNEMDDAVEQFKTVLEHLYARQRFDDFVQVAERLLYLRPEEYETIKLLSEVYLKRGDARRALARLQILFKANPTDPDTLALLAAAFAAIGQGAKAVQVYRELARIRAEKGDASGSMQAWRQLLELEPGDSEALAATGGQMAMPGHAAVQASRPPVAVAPDEDSLSLEEQLVLYLGDVDIYLKYELYDHAAERLSKVFALDADNVDALERKKTIALAREQSDDAVDALLRLAKVLARTDTERAMAALGEALQIAPENAEARERMNALSSGMAQQLATSDAPQAIVPAAAPSAEGFDVDLNLDELDFEDGLAESVAAEGSSFELEFDDFDEDDPFANLEGVDDAFGDLLAGDDAPTAPPPADDEFGDLLADDPAQTREGGAAQAAAVADAGADDDEFGGLLVDGPSASPQPAPATDDGFGDLLVDDGQPMSGDDDFGGLLVEPAPRRASRKPAVLAPPPPPPASTPEPAVAAEPGTGSFVTDSVFDEPLPDDDAFADLLDGDMQLDAADDLDLDDLDLDDSDDGLAATVVATTAQLDGVLSAPPAAPRPEPVADGGTFDLSDFDADMNDDGFDLSEFDVDEPAEGEPDTGSPGEVDLSDFDDDEGPATDDFDLSDFDAGAPPAADAPGGEVDLSDFDLDAEPATDAFDLSDFDADGAGEVDLSDFDADGPGEADLSDFDAEGGAGEVDLSDFDAEEADLSDFEAEGGAGEVDLSDFDAEEADLSDFEAEGGAGEVDLSDFDAEEADLSDFEAEGGAGEVDLSDFDAEAGEADLSDFEAEGGAGEVDLSDFDAEAGEADLSDFEAEAEGGPGEEDLSDFEAEGGAGEVDLSDFDAEAGEADLSDFDTEARSELASGDEEADQAPVDDGFDLSDFDVDDASAADDFDLSQFDPQSAQSTGEPRAGGTDIDLGGLDAEGEPAEPAEFDLDLDDDNVEAFSLDEEVEVDADDVEAFSLDEEVEVDADAVEAEADLETPAPEYIGPPPVRSKAPAEPAPTPTRPEPQAMDAPALEASDAVLDDEPADAEYDLEAEVASLPGVDIDLDLPAPEEAEGDEIELLDDDDIIELDDEDFILEEGSGAEEAEPATPPEPQDDLPSFVKNIDKAPPAPAAPKGRVGPPPPPPGSSFFDIKPPTPTSIPTARLRKPAPAPAPEPVEEPELDDSFDDSMDDDDATMVADPSMFADPNELLSAPPLQPVEALPETPEDAVDQTVAGEPLQWPDLGEELAELDFLLESALADEARELLRELRERHPDHPELPGRRQRLDALAEEPDPDAIIGGLEHSFAEHTDIGSIQGTEVSQLSEDDANTHFDLGLAYKEMGQYKKALEQLEMAARSAERRADALRVIALCHLEQGDARQAIQQLTAALHTPNLSSAAKVGLHYDLASAFEQAGDPTAALSELQAIVDEGAHDFLDTRERIARLGG